MVGKPSCRPGMIEQVPDNREAGWTRRERESSSASPPFDGRPEGRRDQKASEHDERMGKWETVEVHGEGTASADGGLLEQRGFNPCHGVPDST